MLVLSRPHILLQSLDFFESHVFAVRVRIGLSDFGAHAPWELAPFLFSELPKIHSMKHNAIQFLSTYVVHIPKIIVGGRFGFRD